MIRTRSLLFPLALIAVGILVLLANVGVLSSQALQRLVDLWPLLLVIIGLQLVLTHTLPRSQATVVGLIAMVLIVAAGVVYAAMGPATSFGTQHAESAQRMTGLSAATLEVNYGASTIDVRTGNVGENLYRAAVDYPAGENPPSISLDNSTGTVRISDNGGPLGGFHVFGSEQRHLTIDLSTSVPWSIRLTGGASKLQMSVADLQLQSLTISGGASSIDARLGAPKGTVGITFEGGASNLVLHAPSGSQWNVALTGGVSSLTVDGQSSGGFGEINKQSAGYAGAANRFDIQVRGGVSHLDLETSG